MWLGQQATWTDLVLRAVVTATIEIEQGKFQHNVGNCTVTGCRIRIEWKKWGGIGVDGWQRLNRSTKCNGNKVQFTPESSQQHNRQTTSLLCQSSREAARLPVQGPARLPQFDRKQNKKKKRHTTKQYKKTNACKQLTGSRARSSSPCQIVTAQNLRADRWPRQTCCWPTI